MAVTANSIEQMLDDRAPQDVTAFVDNDVVVFRDPDDNDVLRLHPSEALAQAFSALGMMVEVV